MLTVELKNFAKLALNIAKTPERLEAVLTKVMQRIAGELERVAKNKHLSGQDLDARSGNLKRAVFGRVGHMAGGYITAGVGVDLKKAIYGRVHEFGGTIRPRNAQHLTIPLDAVQTNKGVARFTARDVISSPEAFGYTGTFVRDKVIFGKQADRIVPLFVLKDQVVIKPVGFLSGTVEEVAPKAQEQISEAVSKEFQRILDGN